MDTKSTVENDLIIYALAYKLLSGETNLSNTQEFGVYTKYEIESYFSKQGILPDITN